MQIDPSTFSSLRPLDTTPISNIQTSAAGSANAASGSANDPATRSALSSTDALANENTFLQLLVAQIKNQDPTQPIDSTTFLTQLAQFSQLEQLIGIRQDVQSLDTAATSATPSTTTS